MTLALTDVRAATDREWDDCWAASRTATYFHSREWAEIWRAYSSGAMRPEGRLLQFSDGLQALLPMCSVPRMLGLERVYHLSPAGTYGGWIARTTPTREHAALAGDYVLREFPSLCWRLNPYDPGLRNLDLPITNGDDPTEAICLTGGFESILERWSKRGGSAGRKIRKARKEGVRIRIATDTRDWQQYFAVYEESLARWGEGSTSRYEWGLFAEIEQRRSPHVRLWLAEYEGRVIAGCLCVMTPHNVIYWHGAAMEEHFPMRPVNLLIHDIVADACERDCEWFDFNPSGGHDGVRSFKKSFGTESLASPVIERGQDSRGIAGFAAAVKRRLR